MTVISTFKRDRPPFSAAAAALEGTFYATFITFYRRHPNVKGAGFIFFFHLEISSGGRLVTQVRDSPGCGRFKARKAHSMRASGNEKKKKKKSFWKKEVGAKVLCEEISKKYSGFLKSRVTRLLPCFF